MAVIFYSDIGIGKFQNFNVISYFTTHLKPKICGEFLIISARCEENFSPAVFVWFRHQNDTGAYIDVLNFLKTQANLNFRPTTAVGKRFPHIKTALQTVFSEIQVCLCYHDFLLCLEDDLSSFQLTAYQQQNLPFRQILLLIKSLGLLPSSSVHSMITKLCSFQSNLGSSVKIEKVHDFLEKFQESWLDQSKWLSWNSHTAEIYKFHKELKKMWHKYFFSHYNKLWDFIGKCDEMLSIADPLFPFLESSDEDRFLSLSTEVESRRAVGEIVDVEMLAENVNIVLHEDVRKLFNINF